MNEDKLEVGMDGIVESTQADLGTARFQRFGTQQMGRKTGAAEGSGCRDARRVVSDALVNEMMLSDLSKGATYDAHRSHARTVLDIIKLGCTSSAIANGTAPNHWQRRVGHGQR